MAEQWEEVDHGYQNSSGQFVPRGCEAWLPEGVAGPIELVEDEEEECDCPLCQGSGIEELECPRCGGEGTIPAKERNSP